LLAARRDFRLREELREIVARRLEMRARQICTGERWEQIQVDVLARRTDPWSAADEMLRGVGA
jgi:LAO/AO transport system kinase